MAKDPNDARVFDEIRPDSVTWDEFDLTDDFETAIGLGRKAFLKYLRVLRIIFDDMLNRASHPIIHSLKKV